MNYGEGITFRLYNHLPECQAQIDSTFSFRAINFCASGRIHHRTAGGERRVLPAPVFWWTWPGPSFVYGALPGESWDHYYITFSGRRADHLAETGLLDESGDGFLLLQSGGECESVFRELIRSLDGTDGHALAANLLDSLCLIARREATVRPQRDARETALDEVVSAIEREPENEWESTALAERLAVSAGHLRRLFVQRVGTPPHQFVINQRMRAAAKLLRTTSDPVKLIASRVGVDDLAYFTRLFKSRYGYPPAQYRDESQLRTLDTER